MYFLHCSCYFILDNKLDKAVVLTDVPLQDVLTRAKHTLKASTVKLHAFESAFGLDSSGTRPLQQQGYFPCSKRVHIVVQL